MPPVSRSSPKNSWPLGLLFSNNPNYGCPCFQEFPENSIFETYKCYDPFCIGKNRLRLSIFWMNQKILSIFQKILSFFEKIHFWKLFWPILHGKKLILRFSIFWMNQKILSIFQKIMLLWWKKVIKFNQFFPLYGKKVIKFNQFFPLYGKKLIKFNQFFPSQ